jgi:hypothetical protein
MRFLIPGLILLGACSTPSPDLAPVLRELAELRQSVDECRKVQQPTFDSSLAMEDLSKEVRRLRERLAQPSPAPTPTPAPMTLPVMSSNSGNLSGGVGGTAPNIQDLYWVLTRIAVDSQERIVLALYRAKPDGKGFGLAGVRMLSADLQIIEYQQDRPRVKEILEQLKK